MWHHALNAEGFNLLSRLSSPGKMSFLMPLHTTVIAGLVPGLMLYIQDFSRAPKMVCVWGGGGVGKEMTGHSLQVEVVISLDLSGLQG